MSKDRKKTKPLTVEKVENLKNAIELLNEVRQGIHYWKLDQIWPTNIYSRILDEIFDILNSDEIFDILKSVSRSHINDK